MSSLALAAAFALVDQHHLLEARHMQALSFAVHIPLVAFAISFPAMVLLLEWLGLRTGDPLYLTLARRWTKVMVSLFRRRRHHGNGVELRDGDVVAELHRHVRGRWGRYERTALAIPLTIAALAAPVQILVGDWAARDVATTQPTKLAAMEGLYRTTRGAPEHVLGWYADDEVKAGIPIPHMLSALAFHSWDAEVQGLAAAPPDQRPPVNVVRGAFQTTVGIGTLLAALGVAYLLTWLRRLARAQLDVPGEPPAPPRGGGVDAASAPAGVRARRAGPTQCSAARISAPGSGSCSPAAGHGRRGPRACPPLDGPGVGGQSRVAGLSC